LHSLPHERLTSLKMPYKLKAIWERSNNDSEAFVIPTILESVEMIRSWSGKKEVFVTGSFYLVSGLFKVLDPATN
jgi:folylpolyglutamate synthase/dihydropteroate synthase